MLTFHAKLECNTYSPWLEHYVSYLPLKALVKKLQRRDAFLRRHGTGDEAEPCLPPEASDFARAFDANCIRVEDWYNERLDEFLAQFALLTRQFETLQSHGVQDHVETELLKTSFIELHHLVRTLRDYALLNYTALRKILKKYLKKCPTASANHDTLQAELHSQAFASAEAAQRLTADLEAYYMASFHDNDRVLALSELDGWKDDALDWRHVYIGLKMGVCLVLTLWLLWDHALLASPGYHVKLTQTKAYPVYRGVALLLFFHWLWGLTQFAWRSARINYMFICELDPRTTADYTHVFNDASDLTMVFYANFLLYVQIVSGELSDSLLPRGYYPLILVVYILVILFGLFHSYYSPLAPSNSLQVVWVCLFVCSSVYNWLWEVVMDWGLLRPKYQFLGDGHMYSRRWVYYVAIVVNLVLSFSWTLALIPPDVGFFGTLLLDVQPITLFMEPMRRTMWSCLAMENEHLRNTLGFRKEHFIPLHFDRPPSPTERKPTYAFRIAALSAAVLCLSVAAILLG
ncbi:hypothetical protein SDRG_06801 [Saprolegnia diclina VS20]|uniref:SPX domain-containing protein n=1 Tax=Saprolegnia diclina (strain VS20) TaxID=1156394 RepID=T0QMY4_SAPDV|nr:hypothetical protein SDRG_06801 [Saprolegnia diclina VS20]EQC36066.1 hypothetical protein SDRG_06801 [Saprolegnia diclina VS20]|eukprot:XP_008610828.1 hypothetical protein SDRG_06801 [Saprolegnia diclina VS20]